jgi:hypothetical protein
MTGYSDKEEIKKQTSLPQRASNEFISRSGLQLKDNRPASLVKKGMVGLLSGKNTVQKKGNREGLPENLKKGIEDLSGHSVDDVKVHYNSAQPAQLNAHAYAQGTDIHMAPGQEKHLPHEAWHVVQQKQGRVKPTMQMKGKISINDDKGLETEADAMGQRAMQLIANGNPTRADHQTTLMNPVVQRVELTLPNGEEEWIVNSKEHKAHIKAWTDRQAEELNLAAISKLIFQLSKETHPTVDEFFLFQYAQLKFVEVKKILLLEKLANPGTISNIPAFIKAQEAYQAQLASMFSKAQIMSTHQSIGLEFEFATYELTGEVGSHSVLGTSKPLSVLFDLPFVLETDSGNELEIGMPPFLIKHNENTKKQIAAIWLAMRAAMSAAREASKGKSIAGLIKEIIWIGLGTGWEINTKSTAGMSVAADRSKHKDTNADKVYSQLNISMGGNESAAHLKRFAGDTKYATKAEKELILPLYARVHTILNETNKRAAIANMSDEIFTHLAKSVTSMIAAPSIIIADNPILKALVRSEGIFDLHSTVKELHGIWIKDSLPNILRTMDGHSLLPAAELLEKAKEELLAFIYSSIRKQLESEHAFFFRETDEIYQKKTAPVLGYIEASIQLAGKWFEEVNWTAFGSLLPAISNSITCIGIFIREDKPHFFPEFILYRAKLQSVLTAFNKFRENTGGTHNREENGFTYLGKDGDWKAVDGYINELRELPAAIKEFKLKGKLEDIFIKAIEKEIDGTITILKNSRGFETSPKTAFNKGEEFGSGLGVRKDTHIPTIKTPGGGKNVAEIRGDVLVKDYLDH